MKKVIASAGLLTLGALSAHNAKAQMVAGPEKPWSISATLRGFYDDNYDTQPSGYNSAGQGLKKGSAGYEIRPSAAVNLATGQNTLNLQYIYSYMYFEDRPNGKADQSHDVELFFDHAFNERYSFDFTDSFVIAQEPAIIDPNLSAVDRANGDNLRNTASLNFHAEITRLLGIVIGYSNTYYDYSQNAGDTQNPGNPSYSSLLDRDEQYAHLDTRWTLSDTSTGILGYMFGSVGYLNNNESIASAGQPFTPSDVRNTYSHFLYVGLDHTFRTDLSMSARVGVQYVDYYNQDKVPNNPGSTSNVDPYIDLSVNWTYMDGGVLAAGVHTAHNQTDLGSTYTLSGTNVVPLITSDQSSTTLFINVTQALKPISPKLTANASFQYQYSTFNGGLYNNEHDIFYLVGANLSYQFTHYISAELGYNYDLLNSDVPGRGYDRNRVYCGITASY